MTLFQDVFFFLPKDLRSEEVNPNIRSLSASNFHLISLLFLFPSILFLSFYSLSFSLILFLDLRSGERNEEDDDEKSDFKGSTSLYFLCLFVRMCARVRVHTFLSFSSLSLLSSFLIFCLEKRGRKN